jgi:hypothetical protein
MDGIDIYVFLDLGTSCWWVVSFMPRPFYAGERASGNYCLGRRVCPRTLWSRNKTLTLVRNWTSIQPLTLHYTDWATPALRSAHVEFGNINLNSFHCDLLSSDTMQCYTRIATFRSTLHISSVSEYVQWWTGCVNTTPEIISFFSGVGIHYGGSMLYRNVGIRTQVYMSSQQMWSRQNSCYYSS